MRFGQGYDVWTGGFGQGGGFGMFKGGGHPGGRRRMFDGGELRLLLLSLIAEQPRHGYDLIREVEARTGGSYAPSPGVVYPTLTLLEDMGLIAAEQAEGSKKLFGISDAGRDYLDGKNEELDSITDRLRKLGEHRARTDSAPVRRAMGNLKAVLQHRLAEAHEPEFAHGIAALLDEAAQKIERLK